jgi:CheY-like chemotaxis protein
MEHNLTEKQVRYSEMIHASGNDLLTLINDILDLSKIEAGKVTLDIEAVSFSDIKGEVSRVFQHIADEKRIPFVIDLAPNLPATIPTDRKRLLQVLKNLLSNAFKFTERGEVQISMQLIAPRKGHPAKVAFSVSDTGIGIPPDKQQIIFEAFQQVEGGTARKYGGTGLGLSISREITRLLQGELRLTQSEAGVGSTFVLTLPYSPPLQGRGEGVNPPTVTPTHPTETDLELPKQATYPSPRQAAPAPGVTDDRNALAKTDRVVLIVEDDPKFAEILLETAREKGFKGVVATTGNMALSLVSTYPPDAITLDIHLPDINGWSVLDRLKINPLTSHIPVHVISVDEAEHDSLTHGAIGFQAKPVTKEGLDAAFAKIGQAVNGPIRQLLVVEDVEIEREAIVSLIGNGDVQVTAVATGEEALEALRSRPFDAMVLDLRLPGMSGLDLLRTLHGDPNLATLPVIIYTAKDLSPEETRELAGLAETTVLKSAKSQERLLAETTLFLHRVIKKLAPEKRKILTSLYETDTALAGRTVLLVDDDIRNIFALTGLLERNQMRVLSAENGASALTTLAAHPEIEVVLMDIMMPIMDGYETIRRIRANPEKAALPIIAVTAKAMKGDREACIVAGANDYLAKPIDSDQLVSLLRIWTYKKRG